MEETITKRRKLNEQDVFKMMEEWNHKSIEDFAEEFRVAPNTIRNMASKIRKKYPEMCPKKSRKTREDIIDAAFKLYNEQDRVTDQ